MASPTLLGDTQFGSGWSWSPAADTFKAFGGGEEFLRRERQWGPDACERYEAEKQDQQHAKVEK